MGDIRGHNTLPGLTMALFFAFGFCTMLVDTLVPKLKAVFSLNYAEVMLTQFCYFLRPGASGALAEAEA